MAGRFYTMYDARREVRDRTDGVHERDRELDGVAP
jgi:hypothetical protein